VNYVTELPVEHGKCANCGTDILWSVDPDVPKEAVHLCMTCGRARMAASKEVPEIMITKQNEETLRRRGFTLRPPEGNC
jgi:hypothetical protein